VAAFRSLHKTMHTALGRTRLLGDVAHALLAVATKKIENPKAFGPKSHVGLSSERQLNSYLNFSSSEDTTGAKVSRFTWIPHIAASQDTKKSMGQKVK
jgi:hypothetical protein